MAKIFELLICVNCDEVFHLRQAPQRRCPKCAGDDCRPLSTWIGSLEHIATALEPRPAVVPRSAGGPTMLSGEVAP